MADTPKATEPSRLSMVIHHEMAAGRHAKGPWHSSTHASQLETRKQMEPSASGRQIGWWAGDAPSPTRSALKVVRLNHTVPISWMPAAHQSMRRWRIRSNEARPLRWGAARSVGLDATSMYCRKEAVVKKMEPTKKVMSSGVAPT